MSSLSRLSLGALLLGSAPALADPDPEPVPEPVPVEPAPAPETPPLEAGARHGGAHR